VLIKRQECGQVVGAGGSDEERLSHA
jgi:hypothetical protein